MFFQTHHGTNVVDFVVVRQQPQTIHPHLKKKLKSWTEEPSDKVIIQGKLIAVA